MRKGFIAMFFWIVQVVFTLAAKGQITDLGLPRKFLYIGDLNVDSLRQLAEHGKEDTTKVKVLFTLGDVYGQRAVANKKDLTDTALLYINQALDLSQKINYIRGAYQARGLLAFYFSNRGNYAKALELSFTNLHLAEQLKDTIQIIWMNRQISTFYADMGDFARQLEFARKAKALVHSGFFKSQKDLAWFSQFGYMNIMATAFYNLNQLDSALLYRRLSYNTMVSLKDTPRLAVACSGIASILFKAGQYDSSFYYSKETIAFAKLTRHDIVAEMYLLVAKLHDKISNQDSALYYAAKSLSMFQEMKRPAYELQAASFLDSLYAKQGKMDSAHKYLAIAVALKDSLFNQEKVRQVQNLQFSEMQRQQQLEQQQKHALQRYRTNLKLYGLATGLLVIAVIAFFLYRNSQQKQRANAVLQLKNKQIERTLQELKATQTQLIQSEKMASLGELTSGIAHEIQNPLNFVNNFSEVSTELVEELKGERSKVSGERDEALELEILSDLSENLEKINHHGKRADAIVKGMLQHSRASSGKKEPTDINALADEYLRLSYHGFRAKDKDFNTTMITEFDPALPKVKVVPQDIGRVVFNLFNNAFYSLQQRQRSENGSYKPSIVLSTAKKDGMVLIRVEDNGAGISDAIRDKVFQPFFTTKSPGEGTGLGLSLSYDIITKGHNGTIKIDSREGEYAIFTIELPLQ